MLTATRLNTQSFKDYGLIGGKLQIQAYIYMACMVINQANVNEASKLLAETIAVETNNGTAKDYSVTYGEGLTQFDRGTFEYIRTYFSNPKYDEMYNRIKLYLLTDIRSCSYQDLRKSPLLSIIYARLLYFTVDAPIPLDVVGRFAYYKKYYNSVLGATTLAKYLTAQKEAVFV